MKYKNISGRNLWVRGYGLIKADGILDVKGEFHNANFQKVVAPIEEKKEKIKQDKA